MVIGKRPGQQGTACPAHLHIVTVEVMMLFPVAVLV